MKQLKFQKMWGASDAYVVFQIDHGSILPMIETVPKSGSFTDTYWLYYFDGKSGGAYYEEGEMKKASEFGIKDFKNKSYQKKYFLNINKVLKKIAIFQNKMEHLDIKEISVKELTSLFEEGIFFEKNIFGYYLLCQQQCMAKIEQKAQELLGDSVPESDVVHVYTLLSTPTKLTKIRQEEIDWLKLLLDLKDKSQKEQEIPIIEHYKKYFLLNEADGEKAWDKSYFFNKFKMENLISPTEIKNRIESINVSLKKIVEDKKAVIIKYHIQDESLELPNLLADIGHARLEMRLAGWMPMMYYLDRLIEEIATRFGYDKELLKYAKVSEVSQLFSNKKINERDLVKRKKSFLFSIDHGKAELYQGKAATKKFNELVTVEEHSSIKEFKGNIAMKGKVIGKAVVYKWSDDMKQKLAMMDNNSILVTGQTRPQLMPLISKSKAIVTDEGGITSHAAIVSRELGIPCIIGTKIATQVLKDGDIVEVDANVGIVKILNK